jgi:hypothetical protein
MKSIEQSGKVIQQAVAAKLRLKIQIDKKLTGPSAPAPLRKGGF